MIITTDIDFKKFNFPCGEPHIRIDNVKSSFTDIVFEFEKSEEILDLLLLCNAAKEQGIKIRNLTIPYVPFGRQDRVAERGDSFSLKVFSQLVNSIEADKVVVYDPHSDVTTVLIDRCEIVNQYDILNYVFKNKNDFYLICPDGGALKKIYKLATSLNCVSVVECTKIRDTKTGKILGSHVYADNLDGKDCYIADDICDGGATFIGIAKELRKLNCGKIILAVTHGFFTKGLQVFDGLIDEIYTRKGRIK